MSELVSPMPGARFRALEGIVCIVVSMALFVVQDGMMKSLMDTCPIWILLAARGLIALVVLAPVIVRLGYPHRLFSPLWRLHMLRAGLFAGGFALFYTTFPFMGLAEISTIFFSAPLMIALLAAIWLKESIGPHRIGALIVGFAGVLVAMGPAGAQFQWIAILPLLCAAAYAVSQILARRIGDRETALTTGFHTVVFAGVLILPAGWLVNQLVDLGPEYRHLHWIWPSLSVGDALMLVLLGLTGTVAYLFISRAYQVASASLVAPFDYSYLPMATLMAFLVWGEVPGTTTFLGMGLIVASGLYLGYRELRNRDQVGDPLPVAEAAIAPGNPNAALSMGAEMGDPPASER